MSMAICAYIGHEALPIHQVKNFTASRSTGDQLNKVISVNLK